MITIPTFIVKEAGRVYGDMVEKTAFEVNIDPASILGAIGGSYTASRVHDKILDKKREEEASKQTIENDHYSQIRNVLSDLKIIFTPINVLYNVNGQVFEIIGTNEMTPHMKNAFLQKDANYFRDILVNKMNMELQLAEQAFAKRLLMQNQQLKEASFMTKQEFLSKIASEEFDTLQEKSMNGLEKIGHLTISVNFDNLRPFAQSFEFFNKNEFTKVAGIFDYFKRDNSEEIKLGDIKSQVKVGFLPDRVIFLHNGQMLEQISLLNMNEEGYEAFRNKDKNFFLNFFYNQSSEIANHLKSETNEEKTASEEEKELEKIADTLEEVVENSPIPPYEREGLKIFEHADVHPVVYVKVLQDKYGERWARHELEAILKQIEIDFKLENGIADVPLNKIGVLHAVSSEDTSMFLSSFTFEKFVRAVNDKDIMFNQFEGNLDFGEIMFGLEIAQSFNGEDVFLEFHHTIAEYVSEELFQNNIRFVSDQLYDETNEFEKDFFDSVNGFLMRKWKEQDTKSMTKDNEIEERKRITEMIVTIGDAILSQYAEEIDLENIYHSVEGILDTHQFLSNIKGTDTKKMVKNLVVDNVVEHVTIAFFLESRKRELTATLAKIEKEGVN